MTGMYRGVKRHATSARFWTGVIFLVVNMPLGYLLLAIGSLLSATTKNPKWAILGTIGYGLSWVMLFVAFILLGKDSVRLTKLVLKGKYKAWKRMRRLFP